MGVTTLNPAKYGRLCATVLPKVIETDEEFDRLVEVMESLDRKPDATPEEAALRDLLEADQRLRRLALFDSPRFRRTR